MNRRSTGELIDESSQGWFATLFFVYEKKVREHKVWILNDVAINVPKVIERKRMTR